MNGTLKKKLLSLALAVILAISILPMPVFAVQETADFEGLGYTNGQQIPETTAIDGFRFATATHEGVDYMIGEGADGSAGLISHYTSTPIAWLEFRREDNAAFALTSIYFNNTVYPSGTAEVCEIQGYYEEIQVKTLSDVSLMGNGTISFSGWDQVDKVRIVATAGAALDIAAVFDDIVYEIVSASTMPYMDILLPLTLTEGGTVTIPNTLLKAGDSDSDVSSLQYTVTAAPVHGRLENSDVPDVSLTTFTQGLIDSGKLRYVHDDSDTTSDSFLFSVSDGSHTLTNQTLSITITLVYDPILPEGAMAATFDDLTYSNAYHIPYTMPTEGFLFNTPSNTGMQYYSSGAQDNSPGLITYSSVDVPTLSIIRSDGSDFRLFSMYIDDHLGWGSDTYKFEGYLDGSLIYTKNSVNVRTAGTVTFDDWTGDVDEVRITAITGANPDVVAYFDNIVYKLGALSSVPYVDINLPLTLAEGGTAAIPNTLLKARDNDSDENSLEYTVTAAPAHGRLEDADSPGVSLTTFTQGLIDSGKLRYVHDDSDTLSDSFVFKVSDGANELPGQTFHITVTPVYDDPIPDGATVATFDNLGDTYVSGNVIYTGTAIDGFLFSSPDNPPEIFGMQFLISGGQDNTPHLYPYLPGGNTLPNLIITRSTGGDFKLFSLYLYDLGSPGSSTYNIEGWLDGVKQYTKEDIYVTPPKTVTFDDWTGLVDEIRIIGTGTVQDIFGHFDNIVYQDNNNAPAVSGLPASITVTEDVPSNVDLSAAAFSDIDGDALTVTLTVSAGTFTAGSSGSVTVDGSSTGTLTLSGTAADINSFLGTASNIQYMGALNINGDSAASVTVNANDGTVNPLLGTVSVNITAVNDDPMITGLPSDITVAESAASNVDLSAAGFSDVDAGSNTITLILTVNTGTLSAASGSGVAVTGSGTASLTLSGTAADIDTFLNIASNIKYTGPEGISGDNAATLTLTASDAGYTGTGGGTDVTLGSVNIDITEAEPTVTNVTSTKTDGTYGIGEVIEITVMFTKPVTVTGMPQLTLETGGTDRNVNYSSGSGTNTLTFTYTAQSGDESADLDYVSSGALALNGGTIKTASGTDAALTLPAPGAPGSLAANKAIVIQAFPSVSLSASPENIAEDGGVSIITATLSQASSQDVTVTLSYSGTATSGTDYNGTASTVITIPDGSLSADAADGITAIQDTGVEGHETIIIDITGVSKGFENGIQQQTVTIMDDDIAAVASVSSSTADGSYKMGDTIGIQVTFSAAVTVTGTPRLLLETGTTDRTADYVSGSGTNTLTFVYTVQAGDNGADLDYEGVDALMLNGGSIQSAGIDASLVLPVPGAAGSLGANKDIVIDTTAPSAPPTPVLASGSDTGVSNSDNITNDTTPTFTGPAEAGSTVTIYSSAMPIGTTTSDESGSWSFTSTALSAGTHAVTATATDGTGNISASSAALSITIDTTAPTATVSMGDAALAAGETCEVTFTFSEAVAGFTNDDLIIDNGILTPVSSADGGVTYTATFTAGSVNDDTNTIAVNLTGITDIAGNPGSGTAVSANYTIIIPAVPGAPTDITATAGNGQATVSFTPPASDGGAAITGYTVTANPAGGVDTNAGTTSLSHVVTGLTNGVEYTFTVMATNSAGTSAASTVSNSVTPAAPVTFQSATADGASGTTTSTKIDLTFDTAITGLTADNITITSGSGSATNGALAGSGTSWSIAISNVSEGTVSVAVDSPAGYAVTGSPKTVNVYAATSTDKTLVSVTAPAAITGVANGTAKTASALGLPSTVTIFTDDGSAQASVTWAVYSCSYDPHVTAEQTFTVDGTVILPNGVVNTNDVSLDVSISVTVNAATSTDKTLVSIVPPPAITGVANGTAKTASALGLPSTVALFTDDGSEQASVTWAVYDCSYDPSVIAEQTFTVDGTVTLPNGVVNTNGVSLDVSISVTVNARSNGGGNNGDRGSTTSKPSTPVTPGYNADVKGDDSTGTTIPVTVNKDTGAAYVDIGSHKLTPDGTVITIPSIPDVDTYSVGIPVPELSTADDQGTLTINTGMGSITIPSNMLTGVSGISGSKAQISIGQGYKSTLSADVKAAIGDRPLVQLTLSIDGKQIDWSNPNAQVTVSIPYTPTADELKNPESIVIWYIDGSGKAVSVPNGRYDPATGTVTFDATHFSYYAVGYNKVSFKDVASGAWYKKAVSFIAAREITSGTGNGNYSPDAKLTRGEFIVLMMRAYDIAPDTNPTDNFTDAGNTHYTGYLAAAKRLGITTGVGNKMYAPGKEITRQEMFTMLRNALKVIGQLPQGSSGKTLSDFSDAGQIDAWAKDPMTLLVGSGTVGGNAGKLSPTANTTRAEMAQVLYNLLGK